MLIRQYFRRKAYKIPYLNYEDTHRDIVEDCKLGKRQAQFQLYQLYSAAMYNICLRMLRNPMDAEDLLQNSFVDVFTKLHTFRFESTIGAWIKRIVVNNCINFLKKRRLEFEELDDRVTGISDSDNTPSVETGLNVEIVNRAIKELPDGYRVVFTLYLMEGYDHKEIGQVLGITEATSKSQFSRAKRKLREILQANPLESPN
ncbi:MAG: RNA polymerase sigma factor [Bacteroidetes bacterium]|nr:RNA polymerase sigma factor [Bacteroidota bacterium]